MRRWFFLMLIMLLVVVPVAAQDESCPVFVQSALETVTEVCNGTGRNQVCYGNVQLTALPSTDAPDFTFESPGDLADVGNINTLQLSVMNSPDEWGIALMKIQANLPDTVPGQNVTMLLFGDVIIENQADALPDPLAGTITSSANLRSGPGTNYQVVGAGTSGLEVTVDARNEAGDWFRIVLPETEALAWIFGSLIEIEGDPSILTVVEVDDPLATGQFGPMQAFYFRTGTGQPECQEAPHDGILVQTPKGAGTVTLSANEVLVEMGSTGFFTAVPGDFMTITMLEGEAKVIAQSVSVTVPAGLQVRIPLDAVGLPTAGPELVTYEADAVAAVPVANLDETVELPEPLTLEFAQYAGEWVIGPTPDVNCPSGLSFFGGLQQITVTLNIGANGLLWGSGEMVMIAPNVFENLQIDEDRGNSNSITRLEFEDANTGTITYIFDSNGWPTYACDMVAESSGPMSRP